MKTPLKGAGHRFVGHMLFGLLWLTMLIFSAWFKSLWQEPLGIDGLILSFVLFGIVYKALPVIEKLINK